MTHHLIGRHRRNHGRDWAEEATRYKRELARCRDGECDSAKWWCARWCEWSDWARATLDVAGRREPECVVWGSSSQRAHLATALDRALTTCARLGERLRKGRVAEAASRTWESDCDTVMDALVRSDMLLGAALPIVAAAERCIEWWRGSDDDPMTRDDVTDPGPRLLWDTIDAAPPELLAMARGETDAGDSHGPERQHCRANTGRKRPGPGTDSTGGGGRCAWDESEGTAEVVQGTAKEAEATQVAAAQPELTECAARAPTTNHVRTATMSDLTERRAKFVYDAARLAAVAAGAPIVPAFWDEREQPFKDQFLDVIRRQCGEHRSRSPEELHGSWMQAYIAMGWMYGPVYSQEDKVHPDLVPYADLGQLERDKDAVFVALCEIARQWVYDDADSDDA